jgi:mRNA interferase MazF
VRGDVFRIFLRGNENEQQGARYCIVVQLSDLALSTTLVCPTSASANPGPLHPTVEWDGTPTQVLVEQLRAVTNLKLEQSVGYLSHDDMIDIDRALRLVLGLGPPD